MSTTLLAIAVAVAGLVAGMVLNQVIARQVPGSGQVPAQGWQRYVPLAGALAQRAWLPLAVEVLSAIMAVALWQRYGLSARSGFLFAASLVLINTGAVDFKIRMIDTLVLVIATLIALALAPINTVTWLNSAVGMVVAAVVFLFFFVLAKLMYPGHAAPFGLGDVYLAAFIGALAGFLGLPRALFYGIALAGVVAFGLIVARSMGRAVPTYIAYGTYLCLGALLYLVIGD
jgi:leader peptidase (prepilin peptidase)/N-methyltransferase